MGQPEGWVRGMLLSRFGFVLRPRTSGPRARVFLSGGLFLLDVTDRGMTKVFVNEIETHGTALPL